MLELPSQFLVLEMRSEFCVPYWARMICWLSLFMYSAMFTEHCSAHSCGGCMTYKGPNLWFVVKFRMQVRVGIYLIGLQGHV